MSKIIGNALESKESRQQCLGRVRASGLTLCQERGIDSFEFQFAVNHCCVFMYGKLKTSFPFKHFKVGKKKRPRQAEDSVQHL